MRHANSFNLWLHVMELTVSCLNCSILNQILGLVRGNTNSDIIGTAGSKKSIRQNPDKIRSLKSLKTYCCRHFDIFYFLCLLFCHNVLFGYTYNILNLLDIFYNIYCSREPVEMRSNPLPSVYWTKCRCMRTLRNTLRVIFFTSGEKFSLLFYISYIINLGHQLFKSNITKNTTQES